MRPRTHRDVPIEIDKVDLAMSLGTLYQSGRLFEPEEPFTIKPEGPQRAMDDNAFLPPTGSKSGKEITPEQLYKAKRKAPDETIYDDSGKAVDFDTTDRKRK